jgi:hypothetical protein
MTPKFLREEADRFRGMAETTEREASKQRFLAMAADFEARADAADKSAGQAPNAPARPPDAPARPPDAPASIRLGRKTAADSKAPV